MKNDIMIIMINNENNDKNKMKWRIMKMSK